jgi:hypothetical protein
MLVVHCRWSVRALCVDHEAHLLSLHGSEQRTSHGSGTCGWGRSIRRRKHARHTHAAGENRDGHVAALVSTNGFFRNSIFLDVKDYNRDTRRVVSVDVLMPA